MAVRIYCVASSQLREWPERPRKTFNFHYSAKSINCKIFCRLLKAIVATFVLAGRTQEAHFANKNK